MPSNAQNIALVRRRLGNPLDDSPGDSMLMEFLIDNLLNFTASLNNTRNHWSVNHWPLTVTSGTEDFIVTAQDFGRPFLVYTTDPSDTYHSRREIPFSLLNDAERRYSGPQQTQSAYPWSAAEMCFYRIGQTWYVRPVPIAGQTATYEVWYEANYNASSAADVVGLESFHNLIRVQTAMSALPHAAWGGISVTENPAAWKLKVDAIAKSLVVDVERYQKQFDNYRASSMRDGVNSKLGYAPGYDEDDGLGCGSMISGYGI